MSTFFLKTATNVTRRKVAGLFNQSRISSFYRPGGRAGQILHSRARNFPFSAMRIRPPDNPGGRNATCLVNCLRDQPTFMRELAMNLRCLTALFVLLAILASTQILSAANRTGLVTA